MPRLRISTWVVASVLASGSETMAAGSFTGLGQFAGDAFNAATAVSADGRIVAGTLGGREAYRWKDGVYTPLGMLEGASQSFALAISGDGSVVVGYDAFPDGRYVAFRWEDGQHTAIEVGSGGLVPDRALDVSFDGSVIVGRQGWNEGTSEAFRWEAGSTTAIAVPGDRSSVAPYAVGVSSDGSHIAGQRPGSPSHPSAWLLQDGVVTTIDDFSATSLSEDGSVIGGSVFVGPGIQNYEAALRMENGSIRSIGRPTGFGFAGVSDVSRGGLVAVGVAAVTDANGFVSGPREPFIWDPDAGVRLLSSFVRDELGLDASGWSLGTVTAISSDGLTIVGYGTNPEGAVESWILVIPEPSTALLLGAGLALATTRRRRLGR